MNNILASLLKTLHAHVSFHFSLYCNCPFAGLSCPIDCKLLEGKDCVYLCVSITSEVPGRNIPYTCAKSRVTEKDEGGQRKRGRKGEGAGWVKDGHPFFAVFPLRPSNPLFTWGDLVTCLYQ